MHMAVRTRGCCVVHLLVCLCSKGAAGCGVILTQVSLCLCIECRNAYVIHAYIRVFIYWSVYVCCMIRCKGRDFRKATDEHLEEGAAAWGAACPAFTPPLLQHSCSH